MKAALTGHRPERLGYPELDLTITPEWRRVINWLKEKILELNITDAYCGMATGCDIAYGIAVVELNKEIQEGKVNRPHINLHCILPCKNYNNKVRWHNILKDNADEWIELSEGFYKGCDNVRDQYMVDHSDTLLAVWDGNEVGGVWSTIRKARKKNLNIVYCPKEQL